jgi:uncharacterized protein
VKDAVARKATKPQGFASLSRERNQEIASHGGRTAHRVGRAHEWTSEEAQAAGRKGGLRRAERQRAAGAVATPKPKPLKELMDRYLRVVTYIGTVGDLVLQIEGEFFRVPRPTPEQIAAIHRWQERKVELIARLT